MCDTFIALGEVTKSGLAIFGKNSDREPNEAQDILHVHAADHEETMVKCTYIEIPQVKSTYEVILSKPFHMWGAEMGCNEHGVAIGNEAIFTRIRHKKTDSGLTGMDIIRLALERSHNADQALEICTSLIEEYGQDAFGGYKDRSFYYDNSFIISDGLSAWKLETAGRSWAAKRIRQFDTISNGISINKDYDRVHFERGVKLQNPENFSFRNHFKERLMDTMTRWKYRQSCTYSGIEKNADKFDIQDAINILQYHETPTNTFNPSKSSPRSICMHASGVLNPSQTTGSMVVQWQKNLRPTIWITGTSMPCLSTFKPMFFGAFIDIIHPSSSYDRSLWWKAEKIHRWIAADYSNRYPEYKASIDKIQKQIFLQYLKNLNKTNLETFKALSASAWKLHMDFIDKYTRLKNIKDINPNGTFRFFYNRMWKNHNKVFE